MTKKEKWRYESWSTNRPTESLEEKRKILKNFYDQGGVPGRTKLATSSKKPSGEAAIAAKYDEAKAAAEKRMAKMEPFYSDDYLDLEVPIEEFEDIKQQLNVSPMVRIKKPDLRKGLPNILLADVSNKPPTLEDYLRLGLSLSQLSDEERKLVQQMLDATLNRKEE